MSEMPASSSPGGASSKAKRILLAEDNEINQEIARAVLESAGHQVDVVSDGSQAILAVQAVQYDVLLMDIQMPVMDGVTATRHIRALDHPSNSIPIIAMTASVLPQQVRSFFDAGMNDHVGKPFKREELYSAIDRWSSRAATAESSALPSNTFTILDRETFDSILTLLGSDKTGALLERLAQQLRAFDPSEESAKTRADILREAHAMISPAGLLGFTSLSTLCREIEDRCNASGNVDSLLVVMAQRRPAFLKSIETIRSLLPAEAGK